MPRGRRRVFENWPAPLTRCAGRHKLCPSTDRNRLLLKVRCPCAPWRVVPRVGRSTLAVAGMSTSGIERVPGKSRPLQAPHM